MLFSPRAAHFRRARAAQRTRVELALIAEVRNGRRKNAKKERLEKKDPTAAVSEPVKPIVYYIDPNTPKKWIPWLKKGIEDWQPAFEAAGFKNAIIAKEAPMDGEWSAQDARYSVVDWLPSTTENASSAERGVSAAVSETA